MTGKDNKRRDVGEEETSDPPKRLRREDMGLVADLRPGGEGKVVSAKNCGGNLVTMTTEEEEEVDFVHKLIKQQEAAGKGYIHCRERKLKGAK